jgi:hypothetical protein
MPEQLSTDKPVMACSITAARTCASSSDGSEEKRKRFYSSVVQRGHGSEISMQKNPARYFLMAERDMRGEINETEQKGVIPQLEDSLRLSRAGQVGLDRAEQAGQAKESAAASGDSSQTH